jgi:hypothetical protein
MGNQFGMNQHDTTWMSEQGRKDMHVFGNVIMAGLAQTVIETAEAPRPSWSETQIAAAKAASPKDVAKKIQKTAAVAVKGVNAVAGLAVKGAAGLMGSWMTAKPGGSACTTEMMLELFPSKDFVQTTVDKNAINLKEALETEDDSTRFK